jgi:phosphoglycolate phosphatase
LIYAGSNDVDFSGMSLYKKLPIPIGYAKSTDIFPVGSKITVRTLEGDVDMTTEEDVYLMIGIIGEVYPIKKGRFEDDYIIMDMPYNMKHEYNPAILNRLTSERCDITAYARACIPNDGKLVRARQLDKASKVFTEWDTTKYYSGKKGDWLVANENSHGSHDGCYIVREEIFEDTYAIC